MKKIFFTILVEILLVAFFPIKINAHDPSLPPFLKVNGIYTKSYPLELTYSPITTLEMPQDIASENYLMQQEIPFEIDFEKLNIPKDLLQKITFLWEFGDGQKATGLKTTHSYKESGSYFVTVSLTLENQTPEIAEKVLLHILPNKNYQFPKPEISVNDRILENSQDFLEFHPNEKLTFEANPKQFNITSYHWDFADDSSSKKQKEQHAYQNAENGRVFPVVLRVRDKNGLFVDTLIKIRTTTYPISANSFLKSPAVWIVVLIITLGVIGLFVIKRKEK